MYTCILSCILKSLLYIPVIYGGERRTIKSCLNPSYSHQTDRFRVNLSIYSRMGKHHRVKTQGLHCIYCLYCIYCLNFIYCLHVFIVYIVFIHYFVFIVYIHLLFTLNLLFTLYLLFKLYLLFTLYLLSTCIYCLH